MTGIRCFWVERTGEAEIRLRRYRRPNDCLSSPRGYCDTSASAGRAPARTSPDGYLEVVKPEDWKDDPRWPTACPHCGREFGPLTDLDGVSRVEDGVRTHVSQEPVYRDADGREWRMDRLPPGAMFDAKWSTQKGPDGIALAVVVPYRGEDARSGIWMPDSPSTDGHPWTRTGDVKAGTLTIRPSILIPGQYHGFLTDGALVPC